MHYDAAANWHTFSNNTFVPIFTDDKDSWVWNPPELKTEAEQLCGDDLSCLIDVFVTGDVSVGMSSKSTAEESANVAATLSTFSAFLYHITYIL